MTKINRGLFSSDRPDWETPPEIFDPLDQEFGFKIDVCATRSTTKCAVYFGPDRNDDLTDALAIDWCDHVSPMWMNPPYGSVIKEWIKKADDSAKCGALVVGLLPARTDTRYFHDHIYDQGYEIRFLKGRIKFLLDGKRSSSAPFPSMIVIFCLPEVRPLYNPGWRSL